MNAKRLSCLSVPLVLLWLLSLPAQAAVEAGRILFARGTVSIVDQNQSARGGSVGSVFYEGDRIVTGNNSIAQLRLSDGALTALRSHSDYQIQRQRFDEANKVYEQAGRLVAGWMRSVTGAIGARYPGNVQQGTAVATIGIRGTTYQIIHVPDEGLPEFPNLQPGTYVYLESGQVEVSNEAGSRIVNPGQVVRISGANIEPELAPELVELFQSQLLSSIEGDGEEGFSVRDLLEDQNDSLIDGLGFVPPFSGQVSALSVCSSCLTGLEPVDLGTGVAGSGAGRYLREVLLGGGDSVLTGDDGKTPINTGYYAVTSGGSIASQIHWGTWLDGDYLINGTLPTGGAGDWRYIMGDNLIGDDLAAGGIAESIGLFGTFKYKYAHGSSFVGTDSDLLPINSINMEGSSFLEVDMGQLTVFASLDMSNGDALSGFGTLASLFSGGLSISGIAPNSDSLAGTMNGAFAGLELEAVATLIDYSNTNNFSSYNGTAIFERDKLVYGGVAGFTTASPSIGIMDSSTLDVGGASGVAFPLLADVSTGFSEYQLAALTTQPTPLPTVSYQVFNNMDSVATSVYWGIWDAASYSATNTSSGTPVSDTPTADWHYMIATNPLTESMVASVGLTGIFTYNYVNGTSLRDVQGVMTDLTISASTINVDFSNLSSTTGISVAMNIGNFNLAGSGSLSQLYDGGISFDDGVGIANGSIVGTFAGSGAEALLGVINYNESTASYVGTALYEQTVIVP